MKKDKLAVAVTLLLLPLLGRTEPPPAPEPPPIPKNYQPSPPDNESIPQITRTTRADGEVIEEYRIRGKLYMIKVTPSHGEPYYLIDQEGNREFRRSDDLKEALTPPQWVLKRW